MSELGSEVADHGRLTQSPLLHPKPRCKKSFPLTVPSTHLLCGGSVSLLYPSFAFHPQYQLQMPPFIAVPSRLISSDEWQSLSSGPCPSPPEYPRSSRRGAEAAAGVFSSHKQRQCRCPCTQHDSRQVGSALPLALPHPFFPSSIAVALLKIKSQTKLQFSM